jgi:hypothetical protein
MGFKEGVICGGGGEGAKKEGKVMEAGYSMSEAMSIETAGKIGANGTGRHSFKEGGHKKLGSKVNLRSDRPLPKEKKKWRKT